MRSPARSSTYCHYKNIRSSAGKRRRIRRNVRLPDMPLPTIRSAADGYRRRSLRYKRRCGRVIDTASHVGARTGDIQISRDFIHRLRARARTGENIYGRVVP